MVRLSREQKAQLVRVSGPKRRYTLRARVEVSFDLRRVSNGVRDSLGRSRARREKMMSVDVVRRELVRVKMLGLGACGLKGRLRQKKRVMVRKRTFKARLASWGRGRGDGRLERATRRVR